MPRSEDSSQIPKDSSHSSGENSPDSLWKGIRRRPDRVSLMEIDIEGFRMYVALMCGADDFFVLPPESDVNDDAENSEEHDDEAWKTFGSETGDVARKRDIDYCMYCWSVAFKGSGLRIWPIQSKNFRQTTAFLLPREMLVRLADRAGLSWPDARQETLWHLLEIAIKESKPRSASKKNKPTVEQKMAMLVTSGKECHEWPIRRFAEELECGTTAILETSFWKAIMRSREEEKLARAETMNDSWEDKN